MNDAIWNSTSPFGLTSSIELPGWDTTQLTAGAREIIADGNAGGSSLESEALAYEVLARCEFASLLKTEMEIDYVDTSGKRAQELALIDTRKVGVSVVRGYHFPPASPCPSAEAVTVLTKKLAAVAASELNAETSNAWVRSLLVLVAYDQTCADVYTEVWETLDATTCSNIILYTIVVNGDDFAIF